MGMSGLPLDLTWTVSLAVNVMHAVRIVAFLVFGHPLSVQDLVTPDFFDGRGPGYCRQVK